MTGNLRKAVFFILLLAVTYLAYQAIKKANTALALQKVQLNTKLDKLVELKKATATAENLSVQLEKLEEAILKEANKLGIGPMGLGGKTTSLGVNIMEYPTHIAGLPVAVNVGCHVTRSATRMI